MQLVHVEVMKVRTSCEMVKSIVEMIGSSGQGGRIAGSLLLLD